MNSVKNKVFIITGATSGIGREIALQMAALGAELILACRDERKGEDVAEQISRQGTATLPLVMHMDASSQASIRKFARQIRQKFTRLDGLINNAALNRGMLPKANSVDGIELTFATNVLAYFLLTQELLDLLMQSAPARIVNVASTYASDLDLDDLQFERRPFESFRAYAQSKACNRMWTWALARRLEGSSLTVNAMAPGLITETGLYRNAPPDLMERLNQYSNGRTSAHGADTAVWLSSDTDLDGVSGKFFENRKEIDCQFRNKDQEEKLWHICESLVNN